MKFQTKILLVTLSILILTLVMNSVLSLASFEKVYVKSQISTYELICKDLKRKIERSLRFGKPLEQFENMDKLLYDTLEKNPDISTIAICNLNGENLYHTNKLNIGKDISKRIPLLDKEILIKTLLIDHHYHSFISIMDRTKKQVGVIELTFPRQIIIDKLKSMAKKNFHMLWIMMLLTSILLVFLLALVIMRPINSQVHEMKEILRWKDTSTDCADPKNKKPRTTYHHYLPRSDPDADSQEVISNYLKLNTVRNEIDRLGVNIETFANSVANSMDKLDNLFHYQDQFVSASKVFQSVHTQLKESIRSDSKQLTENERHCIEQMQISLDKLAVLLDTLIHVADLRIDLENESGVIDNVMSERDIK